MNFRKIALEFSSETKRSEMQSNLNWQQNLFTKK